MSIPRVTRRVRRVSAGALTAVVAAGALCGSVLIASTSAFAESAVGLGTAESFAVLAGSGITNTGATTITGDVGTFPTTTQTGFGSVILTGTNHGGDSVTQGAKTDLVTAYDEAAGRSPTVVAVELGGRTLLSGVYASPTFGLTGTLTLDAQGDPNAEFIFQAGSTLTTATASSVLLVNGADPCRVVWQVGSSATFGTGTSFIGDVLALTSISANTGATFQGRLLARNGAVTLQNNTITNASCVTPAGVTTTTAAAASPTTVTSAVTSTTVASTTSSTTAPATTATTAPTASVPTVPSPAAPAGATATLVAAVPTAAAAGDSRPAGTVGAGVPASLTPTGTSSSSGSTPALATTGAPIGTLLLLAVAMLFGGVTILRSAGRPIAHKV